jgi:hypothetical protein
MKMEKSEIMIEYEIRIDSIVNWESTPVGYTRYLESELIKARSNANITDETIEKFQEIITKQCDEISALKEKAEAYDRLMSGGMSMKELANILGKPVAIDAENRLWWFPKKPEIGWTTWIWYDNQFGSFGEGLPNGLIAYTGDWKDSLTLPDGLEEK